MTTTYATATVQIVLVDDDMPATEEYGDYRGHVVEIDGQWHANATDLDDARAQAAALTGTDPADWRQDDHVDGRGQQTWSHR